MEPFCGGNRSSTCTTGFHRPSAFQERVPLSTGYLQIYVAEVEGNDPPWVLPQPMFSKHAQCLSVKLPNIKTKNPSNLSSKGFHKYLIDYYEYNRTSLIFDERLLDELNILITIFITFIFFIL